MQNNTTLSENNILNVIVNSSDDDNNTIFSNDNTNFLKVDNIMNKTSIVDVSPTPIFNLHNSGLVYDDNNENVFNSVSISEKLRSWVVKHNISHSGVNALLRILKTEGLCVPNDVRTLMKTSKVHQIQNLSNGSYVHLGVENMLLPVLQKYNAQFCRHNAKRVNSTFHRF